MAQSLHYKKIFELLRRLMVDLSIDDAASSIYALLALSEEPLRVEDAAKLAGYSMPHTYALIRKLMEEGLVEKEKRRDGIYYYANINFLDVFEKRRDRLTKSYLDPIVLLGKGSNNKRIKEIAKYAKTVSNYFKAINKLKDQIFS